MNAWAQWAMNKCAIQEYKVMDGLTIARTQQRSYMVLREGQLHEVHGQSIRDARRGVLRCLRE